MSYKQKSKELLYKIYITDALKLIAENSAKAAGGGYLTRRFSDMIVESKGTQEKRTPDEIIESIKEKIERR